MASRRGGQGKELLEVLDEMPFSASFVLECFRPEFVASLDGDDVVVGC